MMGKLGVFVLLSILLSGSVLAFAISMPPLPVNDEGKNVLYLMPGDSESMTFVVQNGGGATAEVKVRAEVLEGGDLVSVSGFGNTYEVPAGGRSDVNLDVEVPSDAQLGDSHSVVVGFVTLADPGSGAFSLKGAVQQRFDIVIGEDPAEKEKLESKQSQGISDYSYLLVVGLVILILVSYFVVIKKKKKEGKN